MADIDYDRLSEALADAIARSGKSQDAEIEAKRIIKANEALEKLTKSLKETSSASRVVEKLLKGQTSDYNSLQNSIKDLEDQIEATKNADEERLLREKRDELKSDQYRQNFNSAMANATLGFARLTKEIGNAVASTTGGFVKGLQDTQSSFQLSSGLMSGAVDVANQGVQAAAAGIQGVGQIAAGSTKPALRGLGIAAQVAGVALGFLGNTTSRLAKFGIEVLSKELEKTVAAYQLTSSSGALFADGLQGMRNAARDAGLTVDQFSKVVGANSEAIAGAGFGVTEGTKRIGGALRSGGAAMKQELLNLGYSFEEQAGLVAETMQQMRGAGGPLRATDAEVADSTKRYAENLRTIAAISGEDAKKKSEQVRQQANQLAFQQKLAGMDSGVRTRIIDAMKNMSDMERKNFMDKVNFNGSVINREGAVMESMSAGLRNAVDGYYQAFLSGTLNEKTAREISAENADQQRKDYVDAIAIGTAGAANVGGLVQALSEAMGKELEFRNVWTAEAIKAGEANAAAQKITNDELTASYNKAAQAAQNLALALQEALDPLIEGYSTVTAKMLEEINKTFRQIQAEIKNTKLGADGKPVESTFDKIKRVGGAALESAGTGAMVGGVALGSVASVPLPVIGTVAGSVVGAVGGGLVGGLIGGVKEWFKDKEGKARGGVARGPATGFLEKLHGTEAVVPLPDGKTIPVQLETPTVPFPEYVPPTTTAPVPEYVPPTPAFVTQRLELTGIDNIENMARSFVERPTGRLDAGFTQFLADIKNTLDTTNVVQAPQQTMPEPNEIPASVVLRETIEKTSAVLSDLMREHTDVMRESLARVNDLVSVSSETKNINQQLLNNSY